MKVSDISILGRATQGVTLMRTSEGNTVVGVARIVNDDEDDQDNNEDDQTSDDSDSKDTENE
jgi:DNA gyrase subunit A